MAEAVATSAEEVAARIASVVRYTLCSEDCAEGFHTPEYKRCDRCGSMIHTDIFEVHWLDGKEETVGSECMRRVIGRSWGKSHDLALANGPALVAQIPVGTKTTLHYDPQHGTCLVPVVIEG